MPDRQITRPPNFIKFISSPANSVASSIVHNSWQKIIHFIAIGQISSSTIVQQMVHNKTNCEKAIMLVLFILYLEAYAPSMRNEQYCSKPYLKNSYNCKSYTGRVSQQKILRYS